MNKSWRGRHLNIALGFTDALLDNELDSVFFFLLNWKHFIWCSRVVFAFETKAPPPPPSPSPIFPSCQGLRNTFFSGKSVQNWNSPKKVSKNGCAFWIVGFGSKSFHQQVCSFCRILMNSNKGSIKRKLFNKKLASHSLFCLIFVF